MRGLDNPQLGNKPGKDQGAIYNCCCTSKSCRHTIREIGIHASDSFSRKTNVFELCWNSRHFIFDLPDFYCFFFPPLPSPSPFSLSLFFTCILFPSIKSLPSLPPLARGIWASLGIGSTLVSTLCCGWGFGEHLFLYWHFLPVPLLFSPFHWKGPSIHLSIKGFISVAPESSSSVDAFQARGCLNYFSTNTVL